MDFCHLTKESSIILAGKTWQISEKLRTLISQILVIYALGLGGLNINQDILFLFEENIYEAEMCCII